MPSTSNEDEFSKNLQEQKRLLQDCQKGQNLDSCNKCNQIIGCEVRRNYVKAVYDSMSKGATGGFEF